ncbi:MAG: glucose 1-dehydrogenase [Anaerolineae bacterium]|nr:glucose 1-dehydrogenase [Anaerolineae bacterium]MDW8099735.1 glucose 1-dehydrogenase [Anaerolineae bacterium]
MADQLDIKEITELRSLYESISPRYPELRGQVAVITGSSRGIGKGIAIRLAREGMRVVINGRNPETVMATAEALRELGAEALAIPGDVSRTQEVDHLFQKTLSAFGTVDLLVNNAADLQRVHFFEVDEALLDYQLASNIRGPYLCACRAAEVMRRAGRGNIVHISSVGGLRAHWQGLPYDVTKGAIDAMTRAMALELAVYGIRVNAVAPGAIRTEHTPAPDHPAAQAVAQRIPLGRFGLPLEIGAAVAFLASPDASYITGQVLYVDGGITAQLSPPGQPI